MQQNTIYLHDIATVVPEHFYTQQFAIDFQKQLICNTEKEKRFLTKVYEGSAIQKRHTVIGDYGKSPEQFTFYPPSPDLKPEPSTKQRNDLYIRESCRLSQQAVEQLLNQFSPGIKDAITHLITVSCTGFSAPGFDIHLQKSLGLRPDLNRYHVGFMGCYAAFPAMKMARTICLAEPDARVLIVNVELCSLHYQQKFVPEIVVANALFADGITACLVSAHAGDSDGAKIILHDFYNRFLENSEDDMAWKIGEHGFDMQLSYYVPQKINDNITVVLDALFENAGISRDTIDIWAIHPGGKAILQKLETTLGLTKDDFAVSYEVLHDYGNMSSSTIFFVLEKILRAPDKKGNVFTAAFGPGLTLEAGYLEKV